MSDVCERLLDAAEHRIRRNGFHAVSFRDLAADLGIKSASVHYHFPKKADLGVAVIERYAKRFADAHADRLADGEDPIAAFVDLYRQSLNASETTCLCGVMGAEVLGLPETVQSAVRGFLQDNIGILTRALKSKGIDEAEERALEAVGALQGAMMLSVTLGDRGKFETAAQRVEQSF